MRLDGMLRAFPAEQERIPLPAPKGVLSVEGIIAGALGSQIQILKGVRFRVAPGDSLAVVGGRRLPEKPRWPACSPAYGLL
ncbi:MAG: hypothetical protein ACP5R6_00590 [Chlorobaculum sp.]